MLILEKRKMNELKMTWERNSEIHYTFHTNFLFSNLPIKTEGQLKSVNIWSETQDMVQSQLNFNLNN